MSLRVRPHTDDGQPPSGPGGYTDDQATAQRKPATGSALRICAAQPYSPFTRMPTQSLKPVETARHRGPVFRRETICAERCDPFDRWALADTPEAARCLIAPFVTRQIANTYNTFASAMEQALTLLILVVGAWTVMTEPAFTVGMLVAFQMFAGKLSQPVLRIVGLWTQFQQASLAVKRLGDVMNAPTEPYTLQPQRQGQGRGLIEIEGLGFRYGPDRPMLYKNLNLRIEPGQAIAIMGP